MIDAELERYSSQWQNFILPESEVEWLQHSFLRRRLRLWATTIAEIVLGIVVLGVTVQVLLESPNEVNRVWIVSVWISLILSFAMANWNRRDLFRSESRSVVDRLQWSIRRCGRELRTIRIAWFLYVVIVLAGVVIRLADDMPGGYTRPIAYSLVFALVLAIWSVVRRRRLTKELQRLQEISEQLNS